MQGVWPGAQVPGQTLSPIIHHQPIGEINEENLMNIECSLKLLGQNFPDLGEDYEEKKNMFIESFKNFFKTTSLTLKTKTVRCISEIISYEKSEAVKGYTEFLLSIMETTLRCFENDKEEDNVRNLIKYKHFLIFF